MPKSPAWIAHEASNIDNADYIIETFDNEAYEIHLMDHLASNMIVMEIEGYGSGMDENIRK